MGGGLFYLSFIVRWVVGIGVDGFWWMLGVEIEVEVCSGVGRILFLVV